MPRHIDVGSVLFLRYELLALLGRGGMGLVYKALDRTLGEAVALKLLHPGVDLSPEILKRFREEAKLARRVRHRNVCAIHGYEEDGDVPFIVMELVVGTDLKRFLQKVGAMEWEDGFDVSLQVTEGLAAIHEVGVIHRDLKPANITRDDRGIVRVMDFGIAKGGTQAGLTDDGKVVCTIDYVSPEQLMSGDVDSRSDLYSFGVVIYELFTGRVPFRGDTPVATMRKHLEEPPPLHGVAADLIPKSLVPVLERALAKDRKDRFSDAHEMRQGLVQAREEMRKEGTDPVVSRDDGRRDGRSPRRVPPGAYPAEARLLVPTLTRALQSPDRAVRIGAAEALKRTPDASARDALTTALEDQDREVRERVAEALRVLVARPAEEIPARPAVVSPPPTPVSARPAAPVRAGPDAVGTSSVEEALAPISNIDVPSPAREERPPRSRPATGTRARVPKWLYWLTGIVLAGILYAFLRREPAPEMVRMTVLPSPSLIASPSPEPSTIPTTLVPVPVPTLPPTPPPPRPSVTPRPTTTALTPSTTSMPATPAPTPAPTPEPPTTTLPPTLPPNAPPTPPLTPPPTPPPPAPGALVEASDLALIRPVCAACAPPQLPLIAEDPRHAAGLRKSGGLVELRVLVDENGRVADVKPLKGDRALVESAIKAVRLWKYTPGTKQEVRVKVWLIVPIQFPLPR